MDWKIVVAAVGFGAGGEGLRRYQRWKSRRRDQSSEVRNAGFWTDAKLLWIETLVVFAVMAIPFTVAAMASSWSLWQTYAVMLVYAVASFVLLRGLNRYQGP